LLSFLHYVKELFYWLYSQVIFSQITSLNIYRHGVIWALYYAPSVSGELSGFILYNP